MCRTMTQSNALLMHVKIFSEHLFGNPMGEGIYPSLRCSVFPFQTAFDWLVAYLSVLAGKYAKHVYLGWKKATNDHNAPRQQIDYRILLLPHCSRCRSFLWMKTCLAHHRFKDNSNLDNPTMKRGHVQVVTSTHMDWLHAIGAAFRRNSCIIAASLCPHRTVQMKSARHASLSTRHCAQKLFVVICRWKAATSPFVRFEALAMRHGDGAARRTRVASSVRDGEPRHRR